MNRAERAEIEAAFHAAIRAARKRYAEALQPAITEAQRVLKDDEDRALAIFKDAMRRAGLSHE